MSLNHVPSCAPPPTCRQRLQVFRVRKTASTASTPVRPPNRRRSVGNRPGPARPGRDRPGPDRIGPDRIGPAWPGPAWPGRLSPVAGPGERAAAPCLPPPPRWGVNRVGSQPRRFEHQKRVGEHFMPRARARPARPGAGRGRSPGSIRRAGFWRADFGAQILARRFWRRNGAGSNRFAVRSAGSTTECGADCCPKDCVSAGDTSQRR